jgi:hypothetical protein
VVEEPLSLLEEEEDASSNLIDVTHLYVDSELVPNYYLEKGTHAVLFDDMNGDLDLIAMFDSETETYRLPTEEEREQAYTKGIHVSTTDQEFEDKRSILEEKIRALKRMAQSDPPEKV